MNTVNEISAKIPIVVGYQAQRAEEIKNENPAVVAKLSNDQALVAFPTLPFGPGVRHAVLRTDLDNRRLPLDWPVFSSVDTVLDSKPARKPSLAVAAAQAYDPNALEEPRIKRDYGRSRSFHSQAS